MHLPQSVILFDNIFRQNLYPFTLTQPQADILLGIITLRDKWEKRLGIKTSTLTESYLQNKYPADFTNDNLLICGSWMAGKDDVQLVQKLLPGNALLSNDHVVALRLNEEDARSFAKGILPEGIKTAKVDLNNRMVEHKWQIFFLNDIAIEEDFELLTAGRQSAVPSSTCRITGINNFFMEPSARAEDATFNAAKGKIYIGAESEVMEGATIRGPFALCEHSEVKMQSKIYGATTIGPHSKVGGEITNSVIMGYSNKAHDGYLGNSVVGRWCNLGADTNTSNLKNDYSEVKQWNYRTQTFEPTGRQFCGLMMGDHSKCGINTMFNTGTVVGVSANIFGDGFPRQFIPSFSWGGSAGFADYQFNKAIKVAALVMQRRNLELTQTEIDILNHIYNQKNR